MRRRLHRRIADAIETVSPDDLEALAYHYGQAGDQSKARLYTIQAGDRARKLYANSEALHFYNEAFFLTPEDHPDRFHILAARARVYDVLAQRDLQRIDIEAMLELAEQRDDNTMRCDALIALADFFLVTENYLMREPAQRAVEIAQRSMTPCKRDAPYATRAGAPGSTMIIMRASAPSNGGRSLPPGGNAGTGS